MMGEPAGFQSLTTVPHTASGNFKTVEGFAERGGSGSQSSTVFGPVL